MISTTGLTLQFGGQKLFEDVNIKFTPGNCYGIIGANGAGKSTFLNILSGDIEPTTGEIHIEKGARFTVLRQDHFEFDEIEVRETVIKGYDKLWSLMAEKDAIYLKEDFTEEDGIKASELEELFDEMGGWEADSESASILAGLGISEELHDKKMKELDGGEKVKVLLARALFGKPDILLLDEPTNHLDIRSIMWLENFLLNFENTVIVVSHDRHFLNKVCTHIADIDYKKIKMYVGNYDFWYESNQLMQKLLKEQNKKIEEKRGDLKRFIERFSSNASKAKQATSRKKELEKLTLEDMQISSRRFPYVDFKPEREVGKETLTVENMSKTIDGVTYFKNISFRLERGDKVALVGNNEMAKSVLFRILSGEIEPDEGTYRWGPTISHSCMPKDNTTFFVKEDLNLIDWLREYSEEKSENFIRSFLGRMLFKGDEALKSCSVLSGGEKVRCMLSKMMLSSANILMLDEPTNHLDLEAITAVNKGLIRFTGMLLFVSQDHQFIQSIANRVLAFNDGEFVDPKLDFDSYIEKGGKI
ncbi:ABC-F family ATP-binding cassette domain-containing protein [bacterium]|nr:ABC-F family ATP-binding cassette domain-containing protein [bacterium]